MSVTVNTRDTKKLFSIACDPKHVSVKTSVRKSITIAKSSEGASAYEIAIKNGTFSGTEEEFSQQQIHPEVDFLAYYILSKS